MTESGFTLIEILSACVLFGVLAGAGLSAARPNERAERCAALLADALRDAHQRTRMDRTARRVELSLGARGVHETSPRRRRLAELPRGCVIEHAAFGVGGRRSASAAYYPTGVTSPGSVVVSAADGVCRTTQALYGSVASVCRGGGA